MITKIKRQLELGLIDEAKANLAKHYNKEHKSAWLEAMGAEYDVLFPVDENYITLNEWLSETIVVQEAVEAIYDSDGLELLPAEPEITEQVRPYTPMATEEVTSQVDSYIYTATLPKVITMRQARLALLNAGLLATVSDAISAGTDEALKIEWDYATEVKRDWASLEAIATSLGMTSEQLDELFIAGSKL